MASWAADTSEAWQQCLLSVRPRLSRQVNPPWPHFCAGPGASSISDLALSHKKLFTATVRSKGTRLPDKDIMEWPSSPHITSNQSEFGQNL